MYESSGLSATYYHLPLSVFYTSDTPEGVQWHLIILICISLMANVAALLFMSSGIFFSNGSVKKEDVLPVTGLFSSKEQKVELSGQYQQ